MVKVDGEVKEKSFLTNVLIKSLAIVLFILSISLFLILFSFNPNDPAWGLVTGEIPTNLYNKTGALISGFIIRQFGIFPGILASLVFFIWALKLFNKSKINFLKLKILTFLFMIFFGSVGGAYFELILNNQLNLSFSIMNQNGLAELISSYFSNKISLIFGFGTFLSKSIIGISSSVISLCLFFWISSLGKSEVKFLKLISRPVFLPIIWILTMIYNLFFVSQASYQDEVIKDGRKFKIVSLIKSKFLDYIRKNSSFERKKPKIRKNPIQIKSKQDDTLKNSKINNKFLQDDLPLGSESGFILPSVRLLKNLTEEIKPPNKETLDSNAKVLEGVLSDYSINGNIDSVRYGPVVTRYDLQPAPGLRSQRVISLADDIARSMSVEAVRVAMVPGQNVIGIELPNKIRETVILRNILEHSEFQDSRYNLPVCLGKNIAGYPIVVDLAKMPHLLVAGTTGSGKSVGINAMILSLLYKHTPETCRLIMIDPKMLELSVYDGIPHLLTPVVTDPNKAIVALKWAVREMETRYMSMSKLGVRNIDSYNERLIEARKKGEVLTKNTQVGFDPDTGQAIFEDQHINLTPLPFIVVVIDEVADLMLVAGKDIEAAVQRLAQMARAAGIHVVMATQRPSVDVITGTIKANFPTRVSFQVSSKIDSRTILGEQGAEQLLGKGDMLFMSSANRIIRIHGPYVSEKEIEKISSVLRAQGEPDYIDDITSVSNSSEDDSNISAGEVDELYNEAINIVKSEGKASTSFLQRKLQIGYNRAARIIDMMEEKGVVSKANHVGKREVL